MADKKFTLQFDFEGNVGPIKTAVESFKKSLNGIKLPDNLSTSIEKTLHKLSTELESFETLTKVGFNNLGDTSKAERSFGKIITLLNQLEIQSKSITGIDPKKFLPQATIDRVKKLQKTWESLEKETSKKDELTKKINAQTEAIEKQRAALKGLEDERDALAATNKAKGARKGSLISSQNADKKRREEVVAEMTALEGEKGGKSSAKYTVLKQELALLGQAINKADREIDALSKDIADNQTKIKTYEANVTNASDALQLLEKELTDLQNSDITPKGLTELRQELAQITKQQIDQIPTDLKELQQVINTLADDELKEIAKSLNEVRQSASNLPESAHQGAESIQELVESGRNATQAANEIENLKNQVLQFFSITNAIQLFKRTVQSALDTVKELDAVMTETAVVTEFTVGDMWEKLPQYSKEASALGASIRDLYSATTLYYQQGLQTEAAMGVGIETMKMARIANMEAADATTAMTAALRGFNMEVNELNAQRVNDVYSELAAITAADTSQIATAMSKTASIAASANMEFEATSALLAQIIETTQEAPETAGTAMKTIIARFTEVKKLFSEGMLTGEDEEGEEININKIDAALKTVGISLKDFLNGSKGIDDIFLELASKWDDLDLATQRYIATTAAGSRQQSRFIAMMSNYERTMELVSAANNSAGASQEQFDKTLKSMEAKLQKLKNAWDQFAMGLANNEILKSAVDALTGLLNVINKLTEGLSGGNGLAKSIISLMTVIGALKGGGALLHKGLGLVGESLGVKTGKNNKNNQKKDNKAFINQSYTQGKKDGEAYISGWNRALEKGKQGGFKAGLKGFFGEEIENQAKGTLDNLDVNAFSKEISKLELELSDTNLSQRAMDIRALNEQLADGQITTQQAAERYQAMGYSLDSLGPKTKQFTFDLQGIGQATMAVGGAVGLLSNLFEQIGWDGLAKATETLGAGFLFLGTAIQAVNLIAPQGFLSISNGVLMVKTSADAAAISMKAFLVETIAPALMAVGPVLALVAAFAALAAVAYFASPEQSLKRASEAANQAAEAANAATEAYDNLKTSLESIEGKEDILKDLSVGTIEWKEAVSELNSEILDLVSKYPELSQFVSSTNGVLSISDEGAEKILENQYKVQENTQAAKTAAQIKVQKAQQTADFADLDYRLKLTEIIETPDGPIEVVDRAATDELAMKLASGKISTDDASLDFLENIKGGYDEFLEYGRALLASEQAIEVFTDSLLNAATVNAEIPQDLKDEIAGAFDTQSIDKLVSDEGVNLGTINKADKEAYAEAMGYTHISGNKYKDANGNEIKVSKNEVREQLAAINAQETLTDKVTQLGSIINNLNASTNSLDKAFVNMISRANGAGLTLEDITNLKGKFDGSYDDVIERNEYVEFTGFTDGGLQELYSQVEQSYSPEEFYRIFSEAYSSAEQQTKTSYDKLIHMGMERAFQDTKIDTGALAGITDNLYNVFLTSGPDIAQSLANLIEGTLNNIKDPEQAQIFADALNTIDWKNLDDVEELETVLSGMEFDYAINGLNELKQEIITATKATKTFNLDAIKEQVKSIEELAIDIEGREDTERKFTQEEYDTIIKASPELTSQFIATGMNEFVYVGDSMQSLIQALNQNTAALLGDYGEQIRTDAAISEKWTDLENQGFNAEYDAMELITSIIGGSINANLYDVQKDGTRSQGAMDLINLMEQLGLGRDSGRDLNSNIYSGEDLVRILTEGYKQYYGDFGTIAQQNIDNAATYTQSEETIRLSKMEGTEILNDSQATEENKKAALDAKVALEGLQEEYIKTTKSLKDQNSALASNEKLVKASIVDAKSYEDKLIDLAKAYDENKDALVDTNKGTREYQKALTNITKAAQAVFGDNITEEFVENNLDLFEDWYKGVEGSAEKLRAALTESLIGALKDTTANVDSIKNIIANLDGLNFDIYGHADASQLFAELAAVMGSAQAAAEAMEVLGYSVTWEPNGITYMMVPDPDNPTRPRAIEIPNYKAVVTDGLGNRAGANRSSYGGSKGGGGGGGGGGGSEPEKWENPYDEFYNTVEELNEALRERERIERRYQKLLDNTNTKASDLVKNAREQLESLEEERKTREWLLKGRERQMADVEREYSDLAGYASYNEEKQVIEIDWAKIEALDGSTNEKLTSRIEEYIEKLEEQQELIEEEQDSIAEIEDAIKDIREQGKDEYFDLESQIKEALEQTRQEEIDKLSEINDSINDTNSRLIDAMQSSIDKYRQDRENERTEEELSDKQRRLAYLQQDTSDANALEILQLQEEIAQGQEDYTDTLIDQKISELQEQNDKAAEQRQQQIDLMQAQLDHYLDSELVWADIYSLMNSGIGPDGIIAGSALEQLLMEGASFEAMSYLEKMKWLEELENNVAKAVQWLMEGNSTEALMAIGELNKGQKIEFTTADGEKVSGTLDEAGNVITDSGEKYEGVYRTYNGAFVTQENYIKPEPPKPVEPEINPEPEQPKAPKLTTDIKRGVSAAIWNGNYGWGVGGTRTKRLAEVFGANDIQRNYVDKYVTSGYSGKLSDYSYINMRKKFKQYKTGGLANFTGPAWLDGTKSKPEYVLNAEQTKSFFQLIDVLGSLKGGISQDSQITGDSIYDIDINVESIGNDYDVEQLASTIKRMINDDARYRNNNAINLQR